jgi:hypothetical protein
VSDQTRLLVRRLAMFFPQVMVGEPTVIEYANKLDRFKFERVSDVVERWIDREDHWPAWSELRKLLLDASKVPASLAEQGGQSELVKRTEQVLKDELERKAMKPPAPVKPDEAPEPVGESVTS